MSRNRILALSLVQLLAIVACKKDESVQETLDLLDTHAKEIRGKVTGSADKRAGIVEAQKYLDANKADIGKRIRELVALRGFQVSAEMKGKMAASLADATVMCGQIEVEMMSAKMADPALDDELGKLCKSWDEAVAF